MEITWLRKQLPAAKYSKELRSQNCNGYLNTSLRNIWGSHDSTYEY